ncbi:RNA 3'-terminal phosphate cyclase [Zeugodacus cucurbitae]|uniref:RNA 3'-terminal phosphate cyclase n=1 Tax=Zeugodacus cucurbitae TaxID=28588 RepID=UPI0023D927E7|nr:RNA 3'-terminal phosphate cyclase [Zeugodacus cucurbitae]
MVKLSKLNYNKFVNIVKVLARFSSWYKIMSEALIIDGSYLEGGGQILRNALSLSCILQRPIKVTNIRANRPKPGLSNQHLFGLNLLQSITGARVKGNHINSTEVEFYPGDIKSGRYTVDTRTAASVALVLQAALPVLIFGSSNSELDLIGGTNVGMAPQVDSMTEVLRPNLELFGISFDFDLFKRGYYPRGGGHCKVMVPPVHSIKAVNLVRFGIVSEVCGWCFVAGRLPLRVAQDMKQAAERELQHVCRSQPQLEAYKESPEVARDNGSGMILKAITTEGCTIGSSALGERQVDGHALGKTAADELANYLKSEICVDSHVQDQIIIFMALAHGISRILTTPLTQHTRTAMHVATLMTGAKFEVEEINNSVILSCHGIGNENKQM